MKKIGVLLFCIVAVVQSFGQRKLEMESPDGQLRVEVQVGENISYSVFRGTKKVLALSSLSVQLSDGQIWGHQCRVKNIQKREVDQKIETDLYKKKEIRDQYKVLNISFREGFSLEFRAYNEAVAYRFVAQQRDSFLVKNEQVEFNFFDNYKAYLPYVKTAKDKTVEQQFTNSFENTYVYTDLSNIDSKRIAFTPLVVDAGPDLKIAIAEANLKSYPGMYLQNKDGGNHLTGVFAPYPKHCEQGGHNRLQMEVTSREDYIAKCSAKADFPWRILIVSEQDKELLNSDIVYKLADASKIEDSSCVKPGKVAWEWWNNWGLYNVGFEAGVNNDTYMAYIDFASRNHIDYVILDEGWAVNLQADLFQVVPEIDLEKLIAYGKTKQVGIILWAGYYAFERDMENVCRHYSQMGVKGFKIDFMDRDDQQMVNFHWKAAETAAKYKLLVDFHGTYKPTGLNRTFPNVINFEAVHGLEQMKWSDIQTDQVTYDVTMPFIRMLAGPVDYTQGAMRNATKRTYRAINDAPMSQGSRCHQLAEYVVFESPLSMLCDSPTNYEQSPDCLSFISAIPTVWDKTVVLDGALGQYIAMAREKDEVWYLGSLTNWDARTLTIDLSFLGEGQWQADVFKDGVNADKIASDYTTEIINIPPSRKLTIAMSPGGGYVMKIYKK